MNDKDIFWAKAQIESGQICPWQNDEILIQNGWVEIDHRDDISNVRNSYGAITIGHVCDYKRNGETISMYIHGNDHYYNYFGQNTFDKID